jgi:hypothetical protein
VVLLGHMKNASNDNDSFISIGLHAALILNKLRNSVQTNGLGDAGPVDEVSKDDERDGSSNAERCEERESEHPRRASA